MPVKRVVVHTSCLACGTPLPLGGVITSVTCTACAWNGCLGVDEWRWVFDSRDRVVATDQQIIGETCRGAFTCGCGATLAESTIAKAIAAREAAVICPGCSTPTQLRMLDSDVSANTAAAVGERIGLDSAPRKPIDFPCPSCGAPMVVDGSTRTPNCSFCGVSAALPSDVWNALHPPGQVHPFYIWIPSAQSNANSRVDTRNRLPGVVRIWLVIVAIAAVGGGAVTVIANWRHPNASPGDTFSVGGPCRGLKWACSTDRKSQLRCDGESFVVAITCKGPKGCRPIKDATALSCDYTYADPGDPCDVSDSACSTDRKTQLHCDGTHFVPQFACQGPDGCSVTPNGDGATLGCDDHVGDPGDLCNAGTTACASDRHALLSCRNGKFVVSNTCKGKDACRITKSPTNDTTTVSCDGTIGRVGDTCAEGGACSEDNKFLLRCEAGRFVATDRCQGGCRVSGGDITCRMARPLTH